MFGFLFDCEDAVSSDSLGHTNELFTLNMMFCLDKGAISTSKVKLHERKEKTGKLDDVLGWM